MEGMAWKSIESTLVLGGEGCVATHVHLVALRMGGNADVESGGAD